MREILGNAKRIVVKAGTSTLLDAEQRLDLATIRRLLEELAALAAGGRQVVFVTSGAIGAGLGPLHLSERPASIPLLQAAAAVGQSLLMQLYNGFLAPSGRTVAQLLLTHEDFQDRRRYLNVRSLLAALERMPVLPVVNENDAVSVDEIKVGDNDVLAAMVANAIDAEATILLTNVDGLHVDGCVVGDVPDVTPAIEAAALGPSGLGSGGMASKVKAARMVTAAGGALLLAHGKRCRLADLVAGSPAGTFFHPRGTRLDHRKRWIAHTLREAGRIRVDAGGAMAIRSQGRSLLPVGVTACEGDFDVGDAITIVDPDGRAIARGLAAYPAHEVRRIMGQRTEAMARVLGYQGADEVVHRDDLVVLA